MPQTSFNPPDPLAVDAEPEKPAGGAEDDEMLIAAAEYVVQSRESRRQLFPADFFRPVSFDLILTLFIHRARGENMFVKQLIATSGLPQTTALRQLDRLERFDLVCRSASEDDHRMIMLDLSDQGWSTMRKFLRSITEDRNFSGRTAPQKG